ncbi:LOW QUALITY PROTEIN: sorting nexin-32 [Dama dama]
MGVAVVSHVRALPQASSMSVGLQGDSSLQVEISDAVSERSGTRLLSFRSCLPHFAQTEFSVMRQHEEFIWLHDAYEGDPPAPPRSDFEASKEKLQKLDEEDRSITRQEFAKMKQELEAEYLAIFKKTVTIHEVSLQRLAAHPTLCRDHNFFVFLEYSQDLTVRGKNRKEHLGFLRNIMKSADEALITGMSGLKEVDDFFEHERTFLLEYHTCIQDACLWADQVMHSESSLADDYMPISAALSSLGSQEVKPAKDSFFKLAELFERLRELEGQVASNEDLKLSDMLRYYMRDSQAAKARDGPRASLRAGGQGAEPPGGAGRRGPWVKDPVPLPAPGLLSWQLLALADYKNANKALDRARTINQPGRLSPVPREPCCCTGHPARVVIALLSRADFKSHGSSFHENLTELGELELKHTKASTLLLRSTLVILKGEP